MMAKPMKTLELHYPMIQFLIIRIGSCLACVYRAMDARGRFGEHERSVRVNIFARQKSKACSRVRIVQNIFTLPKLN